MRQYKHPPALGIMHTDFANKISADSSDPLSTSRFPKADAAATERSDASFHPRQQHTDKLVREICFGIWHAESTACYVCRTFQSCLWANAESTKWPDWLFVVSAVTLKSIPKHENQFITWHCNYYKKSSNIYRQLFSYLKKKSLKKGCLPHTAFLVCALLDE